MSPKLFTSVQDWQDFLKDQAPNQSLGFVPTMGNLHAGHQNLLERSARENDHTLLSIFINPTQFDNKTDLEQYPQTLEADIAIASKAKVNFILAPTFDSIYPDNYAYKVTETQLSLLMEGKSRPGHFDGMLTVVLKLLILAKATRAYFGEKDYQQLQLIQGLAKAFFIDTEIIACPTIRDQNGLALSSRNTRLTPPQYLTALDFPKTLNAQASPKAISQTLSDLGFQVDYIEDYAGRRFGAVNLANVRLIDNFKLQTSVPTNFNS